MPQAQVIRVIGRAKVHGRVIRLGREASRGLLVRRGVTFQYTKTAVA